MSNVKWIKLSTTMFDDEKIKIIEQMPDADTILIIWIKLLNQAGKTNSSGYIFLSENIPYTDEMLSTIFNRPLSTIRLALKTFEQLGMIGIDDNSFISISNWEKHQNVDGLQKIREQTRKRVAKHRENKKIEAPKEDEKQCNVTVTEGNATEEDIDIEEDIDKEVDKEKNNIPYVEVIKHLNKKTDKSYKNVESNKKLIKARWNEGYRLSDFKLVIDYYSKQWKGKTFSNGQLGDTYLRPSTLFNNKFDERLNEAKLKTVKPKQTTNYQSLGGREY